MLCVLLGKVGKARLESFEIVVVEKSRPCDQVRQIRVSHRPGQLLALEEGVDRNEDRTDARNGKRGDCEVDAIRNQDSDT